MSTKDEKEELALQGYWNLRELEDGELVGVGPLMFTTALYVGLTSTGWERRYCYPSPELAQQACDALRSSEDPPRPGYVASRGVGAVPAPTEQWNKPRGSLPKKPR